MGSQQPATTMQPTQFLRVFAFLVVMETPADGAPSSSPSDGGVGNDNDLPDMMSPLQVPTHCGPCGWIHYRNGNRNLFSRLDVTENIFCRCPASQTCRLWATKPAYSVHIFKCQAEDSTNIAFPSLNSRRKRGTPDIQLGGILRRLESFWTS